MTFINAIGWIMLCLPLVLLALASLKAIGLVDTLMIFVAVMVLLLTLYVGATLAGFK
jgi:hypothetical protein